MIPRHVYFRWVLNFWPCIWHMGAKTTYLARDFKELKVKLPLNRKTRNYVGTIFGGSLYGAADPYFMIMLMHVLGRDYVVWDKAAQVRFKRPGRTTLYYHFKLADELIEHIKSQAQATGEFTFDLQVNAVDEKGAVYVEVTKTMYVATMAYYQAKQAKRGWR